MRKSSYDLCFLNRTGLLGIVEMQINDTLIITDNNFASKKEEVIKSTKIMTKDREHLMSA